MSETGIQPNNKPVVPMSRDMQAAKAMLKRGHITQKAYDKLMSKMAAAQAAQAAQPPPAATEPAPASPGPMPPPAPPQAAQPMPGVPVDAAARRSRLPEDAA